MPRRAKAHNPFPAVVRRHIAAAVQRREHDRHAGRFSAHARGYTREWRKVSRAFLQANPVCRGFDSICEQRGLRRPSREVDHVIPHRGNMRLFWDQSNWQALCHTCHCRKTAREDGGFGRPVTPRDERMQARRPPTAIEARKRDTPPAKPPHGKRAKPMPIKPWRVVGPQHVEEPEAQRMAPRRIASIVRGQQP